MLLWEPLRILSFGAGTPSTTLALMACQNKLEGRSVYPLVPVYDIVLFCDLHAEPSWVYRQANFVANACVQAGIIFKVLDADLYRDFTENFGRSRVSSIPFWSIHMESGKKGKMPRQCTCDYKIKVMERYIRYELLRYRPRERTRPYDDRTHEMHMGIMWEERRRAKESRQRLFTNRYPLVEMGWTRADCFAYNKDVWGLETWASACVFCPFHTGYFFRYLQENEPEDFAKAALVDHLLEHNEARPPLQSKLYLTKCHKRLGDLTAADCEDIQTFDYYGQSVWNGF